MVLAKKSKSRRHVPRSRPLHLNKSRHRHHHHVKSSSRKRHHRPIKSRRSSKSRRHRKKKSLEAVGHDQLNGGGPYNRMGYGPMGYPGLRPRRPGMGAVYGARGIGFGGPSIAGLVMNHHQTELDEEQRRKDNAIKERQMALEEAKFAASQKK